MRRNDLFMVKSSEHNNTGYRAAPIPDSPVISLRPVAFLPYLKGGVDFSYIISIRIS